MERNQERFVALARALLPAAPGVIVEVGARDCRETLGFAGAFPGARIFAFECNPDTLPACRAAVAGREHVRLVERAVAEQPGTLSFYPVDPSTNPGASSLFRASGKFELEQYAQREIQVQAVRLDEFLADEGLPGIDLLWMDIQGGELGALKSLGARLAEVGLVHLEVEFEEIYSGQPLFDEVRAYLEAQGFAFLGFTIYARHSGDAVFANRARFGALSRLRALAGQSLLVRKRLQHARHRLKKRLAG